MKNTSYTLTSFVISKTLQVVPAFETMLSKLLSGKRKYDHWAQTQTRSTNLQDVQHKHRSI